MKVSRFHRLFELVTGLEEVSMMSNRSNTSSRQHRCPKELLQLEKSYIRLTLDGRIDEAFR